MSADPAELVAALGARGWRLGVAESLTGGLLAATIVEVPGASQVLRGAVVAYDPAVKMSLLHVDPDLLARAGTVAEEVAVEMARGARRVLGAHLAMATTGVAGPGPSEGHPSGTVWIACVGPSGVSTRRLALTGDRAAVRAGAVSSAITLGHDVVTAAV